MKFELPSKEHRGHIRRFTRCDWTDEEDVAQRGFVFWKRLEHALRSLAVTQKARTKRASRD